MGRKDWRLTAETKRGKRVDVEIKHKSPSQILHETKKQSELRLQAGTMISSKSPQYGARWSR